MSRGLLGRSRRRLVTTAIGVFGIAIALGLWELISVRSGVLPGPIDVFRHIQENLLSSPYLETRGMSSGTGYLGHLAVTTRSVVFGVGLGTIVGATLGLNSLRIPAINEVVGPITAALGSAPIFVAAPFFLIWFGIQPAAQIGIVAFYTFLLMYVFSRRAAQNVAARFVESAMTLGGSPRSIFRWIYLPASIPEFLGGFRIALAGAWGLAAIAELLGAQQGAGFLIKFFASAFRLDAMVAVVVLIGAVAIIFDAVVVLVARYLTRWVESGRRLGL
ncbi:MAG: ABC transporter permease subunit [Acidimicrobiia bacterium]|nr:ABC transporter permease subunit [Acidimicrobiia bacterium]MDH3462014.1 ABC transporter permease subunit [Acidimicrobiia bacterium]